jgi:uncharacterized HAD superfamily protein
MSNFGVSPVKPVVVAVDVDEVLAHLIPTLCEFHNDRYGSSYSAADMHSYAFHEVWGGTPAETTAKMEEFYLSEYWDKRVAPVAGAAEGLRWLRQVTGCELHIVTARQFSLQDKTREWIQQHYPDLFTSISFGNHYGASGRKKSKPDMCREIGAYTCA